MNPKGSMSHGIHEKQLDRMSVCCVQTIMNIRQESLRVSLGIAQVHMKCEWGTHDDAEGIYEPVPYRVRATTKSTKFHNVSGSRNLENKTAGYRRP